MAINSLIKLKESLERFDIRNELRAIFENNANAVVELQQQKLAAGIDITGTERVDEYRPFTIKQKREKGVGLGAVTDHVTFFMTGELYQSLQTKISGDEFMVESPLRTFDKMLERIGEDKYGLDEQSRERFAEQFVLPGLKNS